jgi:hypothetical protein
LKIPFSLTDPVLSDGGYSERDTCLPFLILLDTAPLGEQLLGSSFIPLTAILNKYSIDSNWHHVSASKRLLMIAVGTTANWRQSGEARKVRAT